MRNRLSKTALSSVFFMWALSLHSAFAQHSWQFSVPASASADAMHGQVDWPRGALNRWDGPVLLFVSSGNPNDRDGWLVRAIETVWWERLPLKEFTRALLAEGVAVIRFDNPGVLPPSLKCRETIRKRGLSAEVLRKHCLNAAIVGRFTPARYLNNIESLLSHVQAHMPATRSNLAAFGFSEGIYHASALADRGGFVLQGLISIGSPAETFASLSRWQGVERVMETLPDFDFNMDGIVTNEEIRQGHRNGINNFLGLGGWLSESGAWGDENRLMLGVRSLQAYQEIRQRYIDIAGPGKLEWVTEANGVRVPDMTESLWQLHFFGEIAPLDVMQRRAIPGLFFWGENDRQVGIGRQADLVDQAIKGGANIQYHRLPGRYHLLSRQEDLDWLEVDFMPIIAKQVALFLKERRCQGLAARGGDCSRADQ